MYVTVRPYNGLKLMVKNALFLFKRMFPTKYYQIFRVHPFNFDADPDPSHFFKINWIC